MANMLAKTSLRGDFGLSYYSIELISILQEDVAGCAWPRVIFVSRS